MASTLRTQFEIPKRYTTYSLALLVIGILSIILLFLTTRGGNPSSEELQRLHMNAEQYKVYKDSRFWASLLQNSVYFLLMTNAVMFFICATTLAWGGWQMSFRRVSEAISACVPVLGTICGVILLLICFGSNHELYHWTDAEHVKHDAILTFKKGFLNKGFFAGWTIFTIVAWSLLGWKIRKMSRSLDDNPIPTVEGRKK